MEIMKKSQSKYLKIYLTYSFRLILIPFISKLFFSNHSNLKFWNANFRRNFNPHYS